MAKSLKTSFKIYWGTLESWDPKITWAVHAKLCLKPNFIQFPIKYRLYAKVKPVIRVGRKDLNWFIKAKPDFADGKTAAQKLRTRLASADTESCPKTGNSEYNKWGNSCLDPCPALNSVFNEQNSLVQIAAHPIQLCLLSTESLRCWEMGIHVLNFLLSCLEARQYLKLYYISYRIYLHIEGILKGAALSGRTTHHETWVVHVVFTAGTASLDLRYWQNSFL